MTPTLGAMTCGASSCLSARTTTDCVVWCYTGSLAGFVLLLGVRGRTDGLAHHTVLFPADHDAEFDAVFRDRVPVPGGRRTLRGW